MNKEFINKKIGEPKGHHLVFIFLFFTAFAIRFFASQLLPVNSYEASILLDITDRLTSSPNGISIVESLLIKSSFFVFGESALSARIWPIIAGSLLVFWPQFMVNRIRLKTAITLAVLITIDPFMIANSIQIGSNIFAVFAFVYLMGSILYHKKISAAIFLLILITSGRGLFFSILLCLTLVAFNLDLTKRVLVELSNKINANRKKIQNSQYLNIVFIGLFIFFLTTLLNLDLSATLSNLVDIFNSFFKGQIQQNSIFIYPLILISYQPLILILTIILLISLYKLGKRHFIFFIVWTVTVFFILVINSYFNSFDLIWINFPIYMLSVFLFPEYIEHVNNNNKNKSLCFLVLVICLISFAMNFLTLIYQGVSEFSQYNTFISLISIIVIITSLGSYFIFQFTFKQAVQIFINAFLVLFLIIQVGISFRSSGLSGSPYTELLWAGNVVDREQLFKLINMQDKTKDFSTDNIKIGLINYSEPSLLWDLRDFDVEEFESSAFPKERFDILISEIELPEETPFRYFGQKFVNNAYPIWVNQPITNFLSADYWSWVTVRRSKMITSYYYIYVYAD